MDLFGGGLGGYLLTRRYAGEAGGTLRHLEQGDDMGRKWLEGRWLRAIVGWAGGGYGRPRRRAPRSSQDESGQGVTDARHGVESAAGGSKRRPGSRAGHPAGTLGGGDNATLTRVCAGLFSGDAPWASHGTSPRSGRAGSPCHPMRLTGGPGVSCSLRRAGSTSAEGRPSRTCRGRTGGAWPSRPGRGAAGGRRSPPPPACPVG